MAEILELFTNELLKNDIDGQYASAINLYSSKYPQLKKCAFVSKEPDELIKKATALGFDPDIADLVRQLIIDNSGYGLIMVLLYEKLYNINSVNCWNAKYSYKLISSQDL